MLFMNEWEVEDRAAKYKHHEVLGPATAFLKEYMEQVNGNSDGWPHWSTPVRAAAKLITLIQTEDANQRNLYTSTPQVPVTFVALHKALTPIKAFYTRKGYAAGMKFPEVGIL